MQLIGEKCAVVDIGKRYPNSKNTICRPDGTKIELKNSAGEKDLGVELDSDL